ncbi:Inactive transglutaminase fused to 7 transmembrane helices [Halopseudomonas litoralis]|uniref:Inactive transglutaminase fused to 7 transmembrane helices n=1 Tax=Halopseudomonas litoralis TaxID=797277 RepID=A0A1H1PH12_9GAMM|nr:inactive transglutaminase family protein [Halopseudomonas litoralis]SDS10413.1 Inactive transglutaminase fused to 7 transmembrane helices [Halopseudomonas litoralis]
MQSINTHLKIMIFLLVSLGLLITGYQIYVLDIPVREDETDDIWSLDAKIEFRATSGVPVKAQLFIPPLNQKFVSLNESFISNNYGVSVNQQDGNRRVTWSARRASGTQTLYYRLVLTNRYGTEPAAAQPPAPRQPIPLDGPEQIAADALINPIRQHSADIETFISETIRRVNDITDDNVRLLLGGDSSALDKARVIDVLLSNARIPLELVHTIRLEATPNQQPELWLRSYNGERWLYFHPETGQQGIPENRLVWWTGPMPLLSLEGGSAGNINFTVSNSEMNALRLAKMTTENSPSALLEYSLYGLPLQAQQVYQVMIMIPIGVLVILVLRNLIGIQTLGTFTPVLIALAFRETQVGWGIVLFTVITALGLSLRSYLEHLKLQMLPRLSIVLTFVVLVIAAISLFSHKLGIERALSVSLFPMVILTMTIERLSINWEERGGGHSFKVALGTLVAATLSHMLMTIPELTYFVFTFPAVLLVLVGFMLAMGRYRGYRLTELMRFKALTKQG